MFTFEQNQRSRYSRMTVHVQAEWVFMLLQNNHLTSYLDVLCVFGLRFDWL